MQPGVVKADQWQSRRCTEPVLPLVTPADGWVRVSPGTVELDSEQRVRGALAPQTFLNNEVEVGVEGVVPVAGPKSAVVPIKGPSCLPQPRETGSITLTC